MMFYYVIRGSVSYRKKDGTQVELINYFKRHNDRIISFNEMSDLKDAKRYEFKTEAMRDKRKYFGNLKGVTVVKITEPEPISHD